MAHMKKRTDGRYTKTLTIDGKKHFFYGKTQAEAKAKLDAAKSKALQGKPIRDDSRTLGEWCHQWRTTSLVASSRRPTTKATYESLLRLHVEPSTIGTVELGKLRRSDVERWVIEKRDSNLSPATLQKVFIVLRTCLDDAVADGLIGTNVLATVKQPSIPAREVRHLTAPEAQRLLNAASPTRYGALFALIAHLGLRKGEALALRWEDVDIEARQIHIRRTLSRVSGSLVVGEPKTARSRRKLPLSEALLSLLETQRARQVQDAEDAANFWTDSGYIFTSETGQPLDPRNTLRAFDTAARKAGIEGATVHSLRHTAATLLITSGNDLRTVSELLGHSNVRTTLDVYAHTNDELVRSALDSLTTALG